MTRPWSPRQIIGHPVPSTEPATLDYFMNDYVDHLEHHLRQILGGTLAPSPERESK